MARKCSICNMEGHNSRTCSFGDPVEISSSEIPGHENASRDDHENTTRDDQLGPQPDPSEDTSSLQVGESESADADWPSTTHGNHDTERVPVNKGDRWSIDEHLNFVNGIKFLGKGQWKAISSTFVPTRTPNQISSHAQKYYKRIKNPLKRKRNPSIFDVGTDDSSRTCYSSCHQPLHRVGCDSLRQLESPLHHPPHFPSSQQEPTVTLDLISNFNAIDDDRRDQDHTNKDEREARNMPKERLRLKLKQYSSSNP